MEEKQKVQLFGMWASPYVLKVKWALKIKGIDYEYIEEDLKNKSPLLLKYNPVHKKVPVLVHDGKPIAESSVILEYIEETWKNNPILPEDPYARAMIRFWCKYGEDKFLPLWHVLTTEGEEQKEACEAGIQNLAILEKGVLKGNCKFMNGDTIGLIDLNYGWISYMVPFTEQVTGMKFIEPDRLPLLSKWMHDFSNDPQIKGSFPPEDEMLSRLSAMRQSYLLNRSTAVF